jgi:hypothetical protein
MVIRTETLGQAHAALDRGEVFAVVGIPPGTERDTLKGTTVHIPIYADATYLFILRTTANGIAVAINRLSSELAAGGARTTGKQWLSFNAREDTLHGLTVGSKVDVGRAGAREPTPALVTELVPLGSFATWQAERAIGDHDRSTLRLRLDPQGDPAGLEPGTTVWLNR